VVAICDLNAEMAKMRAAEYGIAKACADYHELLSDPTIDAVSIVTPTFTHSTIVRDALYAGKDVLCEKPPALTYEEALANEQAAQETGKVLMYGFVCRYDATYSVLKDYIDAGTLGDIYYAEAYRMQRCSKIGGWFCDKSKSGGGELMDAAIHQLDLLLYYMGYPKVKSIRGFTSDVNKDLPNRIQGIKNLYAAADNRQVDRSIESFASCYITFEGGKNLFLKAAHIANTLNPGTQFELLGDKGGACVKAGQLSLLTLNEGNYFVESQPVIAEKPNNFYMEIRHFLDCCHGKATPNSNARQGTELIRILNAIYESAATGKEILF
jgi:predicted dehydrogenase